MLSLISRVLIVIVVFLGGTLVGNIYMPQKELEQSNIAAVNTPATSLNLEESSNTENALKTLKQMEDALTAAGHNPEELFTWQNTVKTTLLLQAYKAAKSNYELQLFRMQNNSSDPETFLAARDNFFKVSSLIEAAAPVKTQETINIITVQPEGQKEEATPEAVK